MIFFRMSDFLPALCFCNRCSLEANTVAKHKDCIFAHRSKYVRLLSGEFVGLKYIKRLNISFFEIFGTMSKEKN